MIRISECSETAGGKLFLAGHLTPPGLYEDIETHREIQLEQDGYLPARLDGSIACYARVESLPFPAILLSAEGKHQKR